MKRRCPHCLSVFVATLIAAIVLGGAVLIGHVPVLLGH